MRKNVLLWVCCMSVMLVALAANNSFSKGTFGSNVNNFCLDSNPYTGDCLLCHTSDSKGDPHPGQDAYKSEDFCYFCENDSACVSTPVDNDGDGYDNTIDCDDNDAAINPGAIENCTDGIDNDCDNLIDTLDPSAEGCPLDNDGDGYDNTTDCNDNDAAINPGATEDCTDGIDNDCDNLVDTQDPGAVNCPLTCTDGDVDTYNIEGGECGAVDCDDFDAAVNPAATEDCTDGIDNDCDTKVDCADSACIGDPACVADSCVDYQNRKNCNADPACSWSGKNKSCEDIVFCSDYNGDQEACAVNGCRWNKKKLTCR